MFLYRHLTYSFSSSQALCDWFCVISQNDCEEDQARDTQLHSFERVHFPYVNDWSASVYKSDGTVGSARVGVYHSHVKLQHLNLTVWLFSFDHLICVVRWMQDDSRRHVAHIIQWVNRSIVQRPGVIRPFLSMWDSYVYLHHFFLSLSLYSSLIQVDVSFSRHNELSAMRVNLQRQTYHIKGCSTDSSLMKPFSNTGLLFLISCRSIWLRIPSHASGSRWYKSWICRDKIKARTRYPHLTHWFPHCCCCCQWKNIPSFPFLLISSCHQHTTPPSAI